MPKTQTQSSLMKPPPNSTVLTAAGASSPDPRPRLPKGFAACRIGAAFGNESLPLHLSMAFLKVHMAVLGESGGGKSKFLELLCRYLLQLGEGGFVGDPANDLADDLMAFVAYRHTLGDEYLVKRTHFLTVGPKLSFRYDPFANLPSRSSLHRDVYENLLVVKAQRLRRQLMRRVAAADFDVMNRLKKRLEANLIACGTDIDGRGTHLGLGVADALADPNHRHFRSLLDRVYPYLPAAHQATYQELLAEGRNRNLDKWESTQNRNAEVLSPLVKLALSAGPSVDFKKGIANREFFIARMGQTPHWSHDQAVTMLGLLVDGFIEVKEAEEDLPPHLRVPSTLIVDEVGDLIGDDLCLVLKNDRKFLLRCVLGAQNTTTLVRGDIDMSSYVLSLCQSVICFAQKLRKDKEIIEDRLFGGDYGFTKEYQEVQRERGRQKIVTEDYGVGVNTGENWSKGGSKGETQTNGSSLGHMKALIDTWGVSRSEATTDGTSFSEGTSQSSSEGMSQSMSPFFVKGMPMGTALTMGSSSQTSESSQSGTSNSFSTTSGKSKVRGGGVSKGWSDVRTSSHSSQQSESWSDGGSKGLSFTKSWKTTFLPILVSEWEWTGRYLEGTVSDQKERNMQVLHTLPTAHAILCVYGHPHAIPVKIDFVRELWATPQGKWAATEFIKRFVAAQHAYNFSPESLPESRPDDGPRPDVAFGGDEDADDGPPANPGNLPFNV